MACFPYVIGLISDQLRSKFFFDIYKNDTEEDVVKARNAEIYWKLMYATLGLSLTVLQFVEVFVSKMSAIDILKDSLVVWAIFYTGAIVKIRYEATKLDMLNDNRFGIQLWHFFVVISMWGSAAHSPLLVKVFNYFLKLFSFGGK
eukprot:CAMPEP_0197833914 /NCGR_PEP_ID=MMETSP1437-20131217/20538_1 /TAXON_ID=49252 ORGANISM="Eucampia antarctica, Strain CCMP1452" /NCGR_SAMPLE_ID=MMETSP1437 /ASSEMBLY_ACC=CAM_ASM_001096 /LENGTH=144 /DNA_ID=CAMNT_0043438243 /DNA_START=284 /DNA_END=718 /DNA_ORIENTATION=+